MLRTIALSALIYLASAGLCILLITKVGGVMVYMGALGLFASGILPFWLIGQRLMGSDAAPVGKS
ncbi:MAG: hypothetical protein ACOY94_28135 [Bacillota bacterium]